QRHELGGPRAPWRTRQEDPDPEDRYDDQGNDLANFPADVRDRHRPSLLRAPGSSPALGTEMATVGPPDRVGRSCRWYRQTRAGKAQPRLPPPDRPIHGPGTLS